MHLGRLRMRAEERNMSDWLDSEEFYNLMQAYRNNPTSVYFEVIKFAIRMHSTRAKTKPPKFQKWWIDGVGSL
jgi:hypothetical protein